MDQADRFHAVEGADLTEKPTESAFDPDIVRVGVYGCRGGAAQGFRSFSCWTHDLV
jgi:hypothetical protein